MPERWFPNLSDVDPKIAEPIRMLYDSVYYLLGKNKVPPLILSSLKVKGGIAVDEKPDYNSDELIPRSYLDKCIKVPNLSMTSGDVSRRPHVGSTEHNLHWLTSTAPEIQYWNRNSSEWERVGGGGGGTNHALLSNLSYGASGHSGFQPAVTAVGILEGSGSLVTGISGLTGEYLKCTGAGEYSFEPSIVLSATEPLDLSEGLIWVDTSV